MTRRPFFFCSRFPPRGWRPFSIALSIGIGERALANGGPAALKQNYRELSPVVAVGKL
jgi:hypothetical protein